MGGSISAGGILPNDVRRAAVNAALGQTLDGQGDILLYEDFSHGLNAWTLSPIGIGASVDLTLLQHLSGEFSLRMVSGTGTAIGASAVRPLSFVQLSPIGIEIAFTLDANSGIVDALISVANGTTEYDFIIRVNAGTGQLQYQDAGAVFQNIQALTPSTTSGLFHRLKCVFNPKTGLYDRIIFDTQTITSLAGVPARSFANAASFLQAAVRTGPAAAVSTTNYIGRCVVTVNEVL